MTSCAVEFPVNLLGDAVTRLRDHRRRAPHRSRQAVEEPALDLPLCLAVASPTRYGWFPGVPDPS